MVNRRVNIYNEITGIKGISAALIACVWHYKHLTSDFSSEITSERPFYILFSDFYSQGWALVLVFFMLSGYGMALGYEQKILSGEISFQEYLWRRIKKLFPVMWVTLLAITVLELVYLHLSGQLFSYGNFDVYHFFLNLYGLQTGLVGQEYSFNAPSWCLSITLVMYCIFYFVVAVSRKCQENLPYIYFFVAILGMIIYISGISAPVWNVEIGEGMCAFFVGATLTHVEIWLNKIQNSIRGGVISYGLLALAVVPYILARMFGYDCWGDIALTIMIGVVPNAFLAVRRISWLRAILGCRFFCWLGKISIHIYLWHIPVQCLIKILEYILGIQISYGSRLVWMGVAGVTISVAALSYYLGKCLKDKLFMG